MKFLDLRLIILIMLLKNYKMTNKTPIEIILSEVSRSFNISEDLLLSKTRKREVVYARDVYMYLAYKHTNCILWDISNFVNRTHATALHSIDKVNSWLEQKDKTSLILNAKIAETNRNLFYINKEFPNLFTNMKDARKEVFTCIIFNELGERKCISKCNFC